MAGAAPRHDRAGDPADRPVAADLDRSPAPSVGDATIPFDAPVAATSVLAVDPVAAADQPRSNGGSPRRGRVGALALVGLIGAAVAWRLLFGFGGSDGAEPVAAVASTSTSTVPTTVPTTVPVTLPPTTTTTLPSCATVDALLDVLDEQKKLLGRTFRGDKEGKEQAKSDLEDQQDAAKAQQDACKDAEDQRD